MRARPAAQQEQANVFDKFMDDILLSESKQEQAQRALIEETPQRASWKRMRDKPLQSVRFNRAVRP